jgi:hypothetical protein
MNASNERGCDSKNSGKRITEFGVTVAKIWQKKFRDLFVISRRWLGVFWKYI